MRATTALCLLLLSGCASAAEQPRQSIIRPRPRVLHINGTVEPVAFKLGRSAVMVTRGRQPCETNDPMPTARQSLPIPPMLRSHPLHVAPMPNACPVTVPMAGKTVVTSHPSVPKVLQPPTPTEPRP
ncbi:MAG TPA: hypothetical protein VFY65_20180 [Longimicrobium sp.]|nr:hypothetical protein [Longimicrobium sp.]